MIEPEVWLRGPLPDVLPGLQPVAHSLLQVREEIETAAPFPIPVFIRGPAEMYAQFPEHAEAVKRSHPPFARGHFGNAERVQTQPTPTPGPPPAPGGPDVPGPGPPGPSPPDPAPPSPTPNPSPIPPDPNPPQI